jgi:hypothetical protein
MIQIYSPEHESVFLFNLGHLSIGELAELGLFRGRKFVAHNTAFEHMMLRAHAHDISLSDGAPARLTTSPSRYWAITGWTASAARSLA